MCLGFAKCRYKEIVMIQFIVSYSKSNGEKVVLWRTGDYQYQIETRRGIDIIQTENINAEYYDAATVFQKRIGVEV